MGVWQSVRGVVAAVAGSAARLTLVVGAVVDDAAGGVKWCKKNLRLRPHQTGSGRILESSIIVRKGPPCGLDMFCRSSS